MKKICFLFCFFTVLFIFTSCKNEKAYSDLSYKIIYKDNGLTRDYFGIFNGDKLIYKIKSIYTFKVKDNKCFVISEKLFNHKWYYDGLFFVDGKLKSKMKGISERYFLTSDFKYLIYYEYDINKTHTEYDYKNIVIRELDTSKILNNWNFSEIIKNKDIWKLYDWNYIEKNNSVEIVLKDSWGEVFEHFIISLDNYELTRKPVNYSKTDPEMIKDLPSVH